MNSGAWSEVEIELSSIFEGKALCISMVNNTYVAIKDFICNRYIIFDMY